MDRIAWNRLRRVSEAVAAVMSVFEEHDVHECACLCRGPVARGTCGKTHLS